MAHQPRQYPAYSKTCSNCGKLTMSNECVETCQKKQSKQHRKERDTQNATKM